MSVDNKHFVCEVILPENSPLHSAAGRPASRKSIAKRSAAFEACIILFQKGYLDNNLLSTYHKVLPQMRNAHLALNTKKNNSYPMKLKPTLWEKTRGSRPDRLYMTVLELETPENFGRPCQPLALLTKTRLPDFPSFLLHLKVDKTSNVLCKSLTANFEVDSSMLEELTEFTLRIYDDIYSKVLEKNELAMSYWLAPVVENWKQSGVEQAPKSMIDWTILRRVFEHRELGLSIDTPHDQLVGRWLIDRWDGSRHFLSLAVEPTMRPCDEVPKGSPKHEYMADILDYSISLWPKSRPSRKWRDDQPVMRVHKMPYRQNFLDEMTEKDKKEAIECYVCPEPLKFSTVSIVLHPLFTLSNENAAANQRCINVPIIPVHHYSPGIVPHCA